MLGGQRSTNQTLANSMEPLGMEYPSHISSDVLVCGRPMGATGCHRRTSLTMASMYGSRSRSAQVGSLSAPMTLSSSCCAFFCTSGKAVIARKKHETAETV